MNIIISHTSMEPIYEQIVRQIRAKIIDGSLKEKEPLPSVRTLSRELKISALTVKKAYDFLDEEGMIVTVHGKGSFVAEANRNLLREERQTVLCLVCAKEFEAAVLFFYVEADLENAIQKGRSGGLSDDELREMFLCILEDLK